MLVGLSPGRLRGRNRVIVVIHNLPVDLIPPPLEVLGLTTDTVVHHPNVFPGVDAKDGLDVDRAGGQGLLVLSVRAHRACVLVAQGGVGAVCGHVHRLPPGVGAGVRGAGVVRAEYVNQAFPFEVLSQPHKSRTKHGICSGQKVHL